MEGDGNNERQRDLAGCELSGPITIMRTMNSWHRIGVLICCLLLAGCAKKSNRGTVTGKVTLDGQPLASGVIRFVPSDGQTATADSMITDGKFSASVPPGDKKISISAPKVTGKRRAY